MKIQFSSTYFLVTVILFLGEVLIATKIKDIFFVRAYLGDVIVVILIYTFIKTVLAVRRNQRLILGIFLFSCFVEVMQYFHLAEHLGFPEGSLMYIVIGNSFSWIDILCYAAGCLLLYGWVMIRK
ncbi:DUF2809 domain-containing protein [uncultured Chryseobacterium sp.]|uniref:ribosomal maturation YjgA family protein n=1 Tax=uncultured Chryseobacterium sp. TaxID=259322 RepID=UPI0025DB99CF|nr:DUF2809 domain-containing protein [uncultured Chryseobacterium sp.]